VAQVRAPAAEARLGRHFNGRADRRAARGETGPADSPPGAERRHVPAPAARDRIEFLRDFLRAAEAG